MIRYHVRWALLLTLLFMLPVALIRAQPYDDHDLRAFLTPPDGCPAPCFMGIRPGVTTAEEAIAILEHHEWAYHDNIVSQTSQILWYWSGQQPAWIDTQFRGVLKITDDVADYLEIKTTARVGDIRLLLGRPDMEQYGYWVVLYGPESAFRYLTWYAETGIEVDTQGVPCPIDNQLVDVMTVIRVRNPASDRSPVSRRPFCSR